MLMRFFFLVIIINGDNMKKILFTGARGGIISHVIDKIKDRYEIYLTVHTYSELEIVKEKYNDYSNIHCYKLDVTNTKDLEQFNNVDLDILVLNSAIGYGGSISEINMNLVRNNFEVNVFSNFLVMQFFIKSMINKNKGKIIFMSSLASIFPMPFLGVYSSTKASINVLATSLSKELKMIDKNIDISIIQPGFYHTGFNQVMFDNKYDWMSVESYFNSIIKALKVKENFLEEFIELKNYNSIVKKIVNVIDGKKKLFVRAPFTQGILSKIYQFLFL